MATRSPDRRTDSLSSKEWDQLLSVKPDRFSPRSEVKDLTSRILDTGNLSIRQIVLRTVVGTVVASALLGAIAAKVNHDYPAQTMMPYSTVVPIREGLPAMPIPVIRKGALRPAPDIRIPNLTAAEVENGGMWNPFDGGVYVTK